MKFRKSSYARLQMQAAQAQQQQLQLESQFYTSNSNDYTLNWGSNQTMQTPNKVLPGEKFQWRNNKNFASNTAMASRQMRMRPSGKGRFGKRAPSFTLDYGHSNDNSNDSGLECDNSNSAFGFCDNSNSESQFWSSTEDLRSVGRTPAASSTIAIPKFPVKSRQELYQEELHAQRMAHQYALASSASSMVASSLSSTSSNSSNEMKNMSPDSTSTSSSMSVGSDGSPTVTMVDLSQVMPPPLSHSKLSPTNSSASPVPIKRTRFNFQPPQVPMKLTTGLKLRNQNQNSSNGNVRSSTLGKILPPGAQPTLASSLSSTSRDGRVQLQILAQPEEQHRARYQTEGSRGAIKDRKGNGFPAVKLLGYDKPATLQIFIGSDMGRVSPHMFYQACKVTGKSSTPCIEKKVEGTILIEIEFEPSKEMVISCDCVGILKERNVDVEQRFPFHHAASSRKKSTKCRLIFRTTIINSDGMEETLQVTSLPILCTQPPGQPEICKKSTAESLAKGGQELFIIGKNFLKDTKVVLQEETAQGELLWEARAEVLKDYLQQNHFICVVPPYKDESIASPVECKVAVWSGGKMSEPHRFTYLPNQSHVLYGSFQAVSSAETVQQSQNLMQTTMQQMTLGQSLLSGSNGSLMNGSPNEAMVQNQNTMIREAERQISPTNSAHCSPIQSSSMNAMNGMGTYQDSPMMVPTTTVQEQVNELQCLLDQTSQQNLISMAEVKPQLTLAPTTFMGQNFAGQNCTMNGTSSFQQQQQQMNTNNSPPHGSPTTTMYSEMSNSPPLNQQQNSSPMSQQHMSPTMSSPQMNQFQSTSPPMPQQMMQMTQANTMMGSPVDNAAVMSCMAQSVMKTEPSSPIFSIPQVTPQPLINLISEDLQANQGLFANAITQLSDNELLNYINPSCFDPDVK